MVTVKRIEEETFLNIGLLNRFHPLPTDLHKQIYEENIIGKLNRNAFYRLTHYLVSIIDPGRCPRLCWPVSDTSEEKNYRNDLYKFISDPIYKDWLSPIKSCYFVNPTCYNVSFLVFQLSKLALNCVLKSKLNSSNQLIYNEVALKYKMNGVDFMKCVTELNINERTLRKFSCYLRKREIIEKIADKFKSKIMQYEKALNSLKPKEFLDKLIDGFIEQNVLDDKTRNIVLKIKDISAKSEFFDECLKYTDAEIDTLANEWNARVMPVLKTSQKAMESSKAILSRYMDDADKKSYVIEFNPETDMITTNGLDNMVHNEHKCIIQSIIKDGKLNLPNLIRGYSIAIGFIMKDVYIGNEVNNFNKCMDVGCKRYDDIVGAMKQLLERIADARKKLEPPPTFTEPVSLKNVLEITPLPDFEDLKVNVDYPRQSFYDIVTPFTQSKHKYNMFRKVKPITFMRPKFTSVQRSKEDVLRNIFSNRQSICDRFSASSVHNLSVIRPMSRYNETISESSGFTKEQISRLLSTKKSSGTKKPKLKVGKLGHLKKRALFDNSNSPNFSCINPISE